MLILFLFIIDKLKMIDAFFFVTGLPVAEGAYPRGEGEEVLRCPDAWGGQGDCG